MEKVVRRLTSLINNDPYTFWFFVCVICFVIWKLPPTRSDSVASWVQAIASVGAIYYAAWVARDSYLRSERQREAERHLVEVENLERVRELVSVARNAVSSFAVKMGHKRHMAGHLTDSETAPVVKILNSIAERMQQAPVFQIPHKQVGAVLEAQLGIFKAIEQITALHGQFYHNNRVVETLMEIQMRLGDFAVDLGATAELMTLLADSDTGVETNG